MKSRSFSARLLLIAFVPATLVALLMSLYFIVQSGRDSEDAEMLRARTLAQGLSRAAEYGVATRNAVLLEQAAKPVLAVPSIHAVRFFDAVGQPVLIVTDDAHQFGKISPVANHARRLFSQWPLISTVSIVIEHTDLTRYEDPLFDKLDASDADIRNKTIGRIELGVDLSLAYENQYEIIQKVLIYVFAVLLLVLAAAYRLARSIITPVRSLTESVRSLASYDYVNVTPAGAAGELDELASGINFLSRELQSLHARQSEAIRIATADLQSTLSLLETKNTELEQAKQRAETASAFKSQFVANVSHEIRTPLNAIIGALSVMSKTGLDITQADQIDMIQGSANTLLYLIEDILDISKIESGNLVVESISTNLETLLAEVHDVATLQAINSGIELHVSAIPDVALRDSLTDSLRLKQVLCNLVSNAIKFTSVGHVALTTEIVASSPRQRVVRFRVEDTGIGIPHHQQAALFSAFTQADMSTTRRYGGTGLGLFICHGIVELLGGHITLQSEPGKGTRVDVEVPLKVVGATGLVKHARNRAADKQLTNRVHYFDSYSALESVNQHLLTSAFASIADTTGHGSRKSIGITHIPNHLLAESWKNPVELDIAAARANEAVCEIHLAWLSAITPQLKVRLQQLGYNGYIVKTPSLIQLKRQIQAALGGQCFSVERGRRHTENRPAKPGASVTILAVDDQRINIDLLMQYFDHLEIRGLYALSGDEAMSLVSSETIDLVLLDLHMPDKDGFQVAESIRANNGPNAQIPVIAMTADAYPATRKKALESGFDDLLTKPATVTQVSQMINKWLELKVSVVRDVGKEQEPIAPGLASTADTAVLTNEVIDLDACVSAMNGREQWVRGALKTYASEIPGHLTQLHRSLNDRDLDGLYQSAHAIKGVSRLFQIHPVADTAEVLERACSAKDWLEVGQSMNRLEALLHQAEIECEAIEA